MRDSIAERMTQGASLDEIEEEVNATDFDPDHKSALWLFAWSFLPVAQQRQRALELGGALMEGFATGVEEVDDDRLDQIVDAVNEHEDLTKYIRHTADHRLYRRVREALGERRKGAGGD